LGRIAAAGDQIVNHSWDHRSFTGASTNTAPLTTTQIGQELGRTEDLVRHVAGTSTNGWFRPPYATSSGRSPTRPGANGVSAVSIATGGRRLVDRSPGSARAAGHRQHRPPVRNPSGGLSGDASTIRPYPRSTTRCASRRDLQVTADHDCGHAAVAALAAASRTGAGQDLDPALARPASRHGGLVAGPSSRGLAPCCRIVALTRTRRSS
jgi:peptidoglycan/xylan/chitin deacetylase (PgdA/CDA1 family)